MNLFACVTARRPDFARLSFFLTRMPGYRVRAECLRAEECFKVSKIASTILGFASIVIAAVGALQASAALIALWWSVAAACASVGAIFVMHMRRWRRLVQLLQPLDAQGMAALMMLANRSDVVRELIDSVERSQRGLCQADYLRARALVVRETRNGSLLSDRLPLEQTRSMLLAHPG